MGRAYEVRKASIQKTGAVKAKLYSMYAKEIYEAAKNGGTDPISNAPLKRLIDRAKKEQVPSDIINRAIDKVTSGVDESYTPVRYELFGPSGSTLIVDCLTDNVNRTLSFIRPVLNKNGGKMGVSGSTTYLYDHLCIVAVRGLSEEQLLEAMIAHDIDIVDMETNDGEVVLYGNPQDLFVIKSAISELAPNIEFDIDDIVMLAKEKITLNGEDLEKFKRMLTMLDEIEDVQNVYHNVALENNN